MGPGHYKHLELLFAQPPRSGAYASEVLPAASEENEKSKGRLFYCPAKKL
jgi:hypothetical protein